MLPDDNHYSDERQIPKAQEATNEGNAHVSNNAAQLCRPGRGSELDFLNDLPPLPGLSGPDASAAEQPLFPLPPRPLAPVKCERAEEDGHATVRLVHQCVSEGELSAGVHGQHKQRSGQQLGAALCTATVTLEDLRKVFSLPRAAAARKLSISNNSLKRVCRDKGITRWPHRKLLSLDNLAHACASDLVLDKDDAKALLHAIEAERVRMIQDPNRPVDKALMKMRQTSYKKRYAQRRKQTDAQLSGRRSEAGKVSGELRQGAFSGGGVSSDSDDSSDDSSSGKEGESEDEEEEDEEHGEQQKRRPQRPIAGGSDRRMSAAAGERTAGSMLRAEAAAMGRSTTRAPGDVSMAKGGSGRVPPGGKQAAAVATGGRMSIDQEATIVAAAGRSSMDGLACSAAPGTAQTWYKAQAEGLVKAEELQAQAVGPIMSAGPCGTLSNLGQKRKEVSDAGAVVKCPHSPGAPAHTAAAGLTAKLPPVSLRRVISGIALVAATTEHHHPAVVSGGGSPEPAPPSPEQLRSVRSSQSAEWQDPPEAARLGGWEGHRITAPQRQSMPQLPASAALGHDSPSAPPSTGLEPGSLATPMPGCLPGLCDSGGLTLSPSPPAMGGSVQGVQGAQGAACATHEGPLAHLPSGTHTAHASASRSCSPLPHMHASWDAAVARETRARGASQALAQQLVQAQPGESGQEVKQALGSSFPGFHSSPSSYEHKPEQYRGVPGAYVHLQASPTADVTSHWDDAMLYRGVGWSSSGAGAGISSPSPEPKGAQEHVPHVFLEMGDTRDGFSFLDGVPSDCLDDGLPPQLLLSTGALTSSPTVGSCGGSGAISGAAQESRPSRKLQAGRHAFFSPPSNVGISHSLSLVEFLALPLSQLPHTTQQPHNRHHPGQLGPGHTQRLLHSAPPAGGVQHGVLLPLPPAQVPPLKPAVPPQVNFQEGGLGGGGGDDVFLDGADTWQVACIGDMLGGGPAQAHCSYWPHTHIKSEPLPFMGTRALRCGSNDGAGPPVHMTLTGPPTASTMPWGGGSGGAGSGPGVHSAPLAQFSMLPAMAQEMQRQGSGVSSIQKPSTAVFHAGPETDVRARHHSGVHTALAGGGQSGHAPDAVRHLGCAPTTLGALMPDAVQLLPRANTAGPPSARTAAVLRRSTSVSPPWPPLDAVAATTAGHHGFWEGERAAPDGRGPHDAGISRIPPLCPHPPREASTRPPPAWEQHGAVVASRSGGTQPGVHAHVSHLHAAAASAAPACGSSSVDAGCGMAGEPLHQPVMPFEPATDLVPVPLQPSDSRGGGGMQDECDALLATMTEIMTSDDLEVMMNTGDQLTALDFMLRSFEMQDPTK